MQVKYKVNVNDKAILNKRTLDRIDNELDKRKFLRNILRIVVIGIILVIVIYLIVSGRKEGMRIAENYDNLKANLKDSKRSFDRRVKLFEKDADGNIILTDTTLSSLAEATQEEVIGTPSSTPMDGAGTYKPVKDGGISTSGTKTSMRASNGHIEIDTYTGVPAEWNGDNAEYFTIEETFNAWKDWYKQSFGREYPHGYKVAYNEESDRNKNSPAYPNYEVTVKGVECFCVATPPFWDTNKFSENTKQEPETCYDYKYLAIMKSETSDDKVYVPLFPGDRKGHTWPGCFLQTTISHGSDDYSGGGFIFDDDNTTSRFPPNLEGDSDKSRAMAVEQFETGEWWSYYLGGKQYDYVMSNLDILAQFSVEVQIPSGCKAAKDFGLSGYKIYGIVRCPTNASEVQ